MLLQENKSEYGSQNIATMTLETEITENDKSKLFKKVKRESLTVKIRLYKDSINHHREQNNTVEIWNRIEVEYSLTKKIGKQWYGHAKECQNTVGQK